MKTPNTGRGRGKNGGPPPPLPPADEIDHDDLIATPPAELVQYLLTMLRTHDLGEPGMGAILFKYLGALLELLTKTDDPSLMTPVQKLTRDIRDASRRLGRTEARFLVDAYYKLQEDRIRSAHQVRTLSQTAEGKPVEPHEVISWLLLQEETLEKQIRAALDVYSLNDTAGMWARSNLGIGPVIAAGLLAHIDIERAPTVGHIWRFAGLDPTNQWLKGQKRPWNAALKRLCFLIGESFVKVSNRPLDVYGKLYKSRKEWETERNERGEYAEQAKLALEQKRFGQDTEAFKHYSAGRLPPARIHLRAQRRAVKIFLAHLHEVMFWVRYEELPPFPYVLEHVPGHVHRIEVPNLELLPDLAEAKAKAQRGPRPTR